MDAQAQMEEFNRTMQGRLPGLLGVEFTHLEYGLAVVELHLRPEILNTRGRLHAGTIVSVADTACGGGCWVSLPEGCSGWTTMELKSNLVGSANEGHIVCEARLRHGGRTTQQPPPHAVSATDTMVPA